VTIGYDEEWEEGRIGAVLWDIEKIKYILAPLGS
jgi:hypothetical protein